MVTYAGKYYFVKMIQLKCWVIVTDNANGLDVHTCIGLIVNTIVSFKNRS